MAFNNDGVSVPKNDKPKTPESVKGDIKDKTLNGDVIKDNIKSAADVKNQINPDSDQNLENIIDSDRSGDAGSALCESDAMQDDNGLKPGLDDLKQGFDKLSDKGDKDKTKDNKDGKTDKDSKPKDLAIDSDGFGNKGALNDKDVSDNLKDKPKDKNKTKDKNKDKFGDKGKGKDKGKSKGKGDGLKKGLKKNPLAKQAKRAALIGAAKGGVIGGAAMGGLKLLSMLIMLVIRVAGIITGGLAGILSAIVAPFVFIWNGLVSAISALFGIAQTIAKIFVGIGLAVVAVVSIIVGVTINNNSSGVVLSDKQIEEKCIEDAEEVKTQIASASLDADTANAQVMEWGKRFYSVFHEYGLSDEQIAGMLGNFNIETYGSTELGIDPTCIEHIESMYPEERFIYGPHKQECEANGFITGREIMNEKTAGIGLTQYTDTKTGGTSLTRFINWCKENNLKWYELDTQLANMLVQSTPTGKGVPQFWDDYKKQTGDARECASWFARYYVGNRNMAQDARQNMAERWFEVIKTFEVDDSAGTFLASLEGLQLGNNNKLVVASQDTDECGNVINSSSNYASSMGTLPEVFVKTFLGCSHNPDGLSGAQCVETFYLFNEWIGIQDEIGIGFVYARYMGQHIDKSNRITAKYYERIDDVNQIQDGDWVITDQTAANEAGHIHMAYKGYAFSQNQGGGYNGYPCSLIKDTFRSRYICHFRLKNPAAFTPNTAKLQHVINTKWTSITLPPGL